MSLAEGLSLDAEGGAEVEILLVSADPLALRAQLIGSEPSRVLVRAGLLRTLDAPWQDLCTAMGRTSDELLDELFAGGLCVVGVRATAAESTGERWWCAVTLVSKATVDRLTARLEAAPRGVIEGVAGAQAVLSIDRGSMALMVRRLERPAGEPAAVDGGDAPRATQRNHAAVLMSAQTPPAIMAKLTGLLSNRPAQPALRHSPPVLVGADAPAPPAPPATLRPAGSLGALALWQRARAWNGLAGPHGRVHGWFRGGQPDHSLAGGLMVQGDRWTLRSISSHTSGPAELAAVARGGEPARKLLDPGLINRLMPETQQLFAQPAGGGVLLAAHAAWQELLWLDAGRRELTLGPVPSRPVPGGPIAGKAVAAGASQAPLVGPVVAVVRAPASGGHMSVQLAVRCDQSQSAGTLDAVGLALLKVLRDRATPPSAELLALAGSNGRRAVRAQLPPGTTGFPWVGDGAELAWWGWTEAAAQADIPPGVQSSNAWCVWQATPAQPREAPEGGGVWPGPETAEAALRGAIMPDPAGLANVGAEVGAEVGADVATARRYTVRVRSSPRGLLAQLPPALALIGAQVSSLHRLDLDAWLTEAGPEQILQHVEVRVLWGP